MTNKNQAPKFASKIIGQTRLRRSITVAMFFGTTLAACGSSASATTSGTSTAAKTPLYLLSSEGYDSAECSAFQKATGIVCKLSDNSTGPTLAEIQATKNNPHWGVAWTDGNAPYAALDLQGMLLKNFEPTTGTLTSLGQKLVPPDKSYIPTGLTTAGAFIYNSAIVKTPPQTWQDLLSPQWKGKVGMNNPAVDGPSYPILASLFKSLGGVSQGEAFMTKLKANGFYVSSNSIADDLLAGKVEIAIGQNTSGLGRAFKNPNIKVYYPNPSAALPSTMAIDGKASAGEIADAKAFANFVYSPAGQKVMLSGDPQGDSQFFPIIQGSVARSNVPAASSIPFSFPNPYKWGPLEASINTWFTTNVA
ncbi:ABC transporter substrate-binding protein [Acidithrix ferrooxidans]|uniref:Putative 2-aminoethylphosphonate-binding periplasmic protein n=1 Tax=Acidithrix ferrooxidans TaxID=1280514 RepID=A0A0D8HG69_9ACTN|nr:extracellular solute-binding protein [Acidithrix ferrooxidans]KJF16061.1 putative 2-aminoethylphosphonate-binding periplasmic protein precursor [Acidithrix ferrooxidans]